MEVPQGNRGGPVTRALDPASAPVPPRTTATLAVDANENSHLWQLPSHRMQVFFFAAPAAQGQVFCISAPG
eukprot:CAMPEP_0179104038 /NCGR_PEP_ID=MMETSP0796-20121207/48239_1 /TAXON_ID=73915 /ORGANISM="Pyrodinium bahamense, Strain pbaha01" /LENGTH=70 /DNA_ID=CAMNT_0020801967 /DNA_START=76 /DNA_END=285 /DNA_ORIENTATION=+